MTHPSDIDGNIDITHYSRAASQDVSGASVVVTRPPAPATLKWSGAECRPGDLETQTSAFVRANYEPSTQKYSRSIVQYQQHEYSKM